MTDYLHTFRAHAFLISGLILLLQPAWGQGDIDRSLQDTVRSEQTVPVDSSYSQTSYGITVLRFTGSEMRNAYGYGVNFSGTTFRWVGTEGGAMISLGGFSGSGSPGKVNSLMKVKSSALKFWALNFSLAGLYRPTSSSPQTTVTPFIGAGFFLLGGAEKINASIIRDTPTLYEEVSGDAWAIRGSIGLFPVVGVSIPITDRFAIQTLVMMYWGTGSGFTDLLNEDKKKLFDEKIYTVVHRPDFRFTGLSFYLGISF